MCLYSKLHGQGKSQSCYYYCLVTCSNGKLGKYVQLVVGGGGGGVVGGVGSER